MGSRVRVRTSRMVCAALAAGAALACPQPQTRCDSDVDCAEGRKCDPTTRTCVTPAAPEPGAEAGACLPDGTCHPGLVCLSQVCVRAPDGGDAVLLSEPFDSPNNHFDFRGGDWSVSGGRLVLASPTSAAVQVYGNQNTAVHKAFVPGDFDLSVMARTTDPRIYADFSILFGWEGPHDYWFASFSTDDDPFTHGLFQVSDGGQLERATFTHTVARDTWYGVRVAQEGGLISVSRDGVLQAAVAASVASGRVGLGTRNNTVEFDDLLVHRRAPGPTPDAGRDGGMPDAAGRP